MYQRKTRTSPWAWILATCSFKFAPAHSALPFAVFWALSTSHSSVLKVTTILAPLMRNLASKSDGTSKHGQAVLYEGHILARFSALSTSLGAVVYELSWILGVIVNHSSQKKACVRPNVHRKFHGLSQA